MHILIDLDIGIFNIISYAYISTHSFIDFSISISRITKSLILSIQIINQSILLNP